MSMFDEPATAPYQPRSETSRLAAQALTPLKLSKRRRQILQAFLAWGPCTSDRIGQHLRLNPTSSVAPRTGELEAAGYVEKAGRRERTRTGNAAEVYRITGEGITALAQGEQS